MKIELKNTFAGIALVVALSLGAVGCTTGKVSGGGRLVAETCDSTYVCDPNSIQLLPFSTNVSVKPDQKSKTGYVVNGHLTIQDPNSNQKFFGKPVLAGAVCANFPTDCVPTGSVYRQAMFNRLGSASSVQNAIKGLQSKGGLYWSLGCYVISNSFSDSKQNDCADETDPLYLSIIADLDGNGPGSGDWVAVVADNSFLGSLYCDLFPNNQNCSAPAPGDPYVILGYVANGNLSVKVNDITIEDLPYNVAMNGVQVGRLRLQKQQNKNGYNLSLSADGLDLGLFQLPVNDAYTSAANNQVCSSQFTRVSTHGNRVINEQTSCQSGKATRTNRLSGSQSTTSTATCSRDALATLQNVRQQLAAGVAPTAGTVYFGAAYNVTASAVTSEQVTIGGITETADKVTFQSQGPASQWSFDVLFSRNADRTPLVVRASGGFTATIIR